MEEVIATSEDFVKEWRVINRELNSISALLDESDAWVLTLPESRLQFTRTIDRRSELEETLSDLLVKTVKAYCKAKERKFPPLDMNVVHAGRFIEIIWADSDSKDEDD